MAERMTRKDQYMSACNINNGSGCSASNTSCKQKLKKLREIDFAITDTVLYLDAYPECEEALKYYQALKKEREALVNDMNKNACPPISNQHAAYSGAWDWIDSPWPWEPDAN